MSKSELSFTTFFAVLPERTGSANYESYTAAIKLAMWCGKYGCTFIEIPLLRTDLARDLIVQQFLKLSQNEDDLLVMIDADHKYKPDLIEQLAKNPSDFGIVGALVFRRMHPHDPLFFQIRDDGKLRTPGLWDGSNQYLIQGDATGSGVLSIRRWVFTKLKEAGVEPPYFQYTYPNGGNQSEDVHFAKTCQKVGIAQYCDTTVEAPHLVVEWADRNRWRKYLNLVQTPTEDRVSVVIPSSGRPDQAKACVEQLFETTAGWNVECLLVVEPPPNGFDSSGEQKDVFGRYSEIGEIGRTVVLLRDQWCGPIAGWNEGLEHATGYYYMFAADDLVWGQRWLPEALDCFRYFPDGEGLVGFNDRMTNGEEIATHFMISRKFCTEHHGGVLAFPPYVQYFTDIESTFRAKEADRYYWARHSYVEHKHHLWGKADIDTTYTVGNRNYSRDKQMYAHRVTMNFPNDFDPVLLAEQAPPV